MADFKLRYDELRGQYDLVCADDGGLALDEGPESRVINAVLTWARALEGDPLPGFSGDVKGHWADAWDPRKRKGSRCWLLNGRIINDRAITDAKGYLLESLQQLVDDGTVASDDVSISRLGKTGLGALVTLTLDAGLTKQVVINSLMG